MKISEVNGSQSIESVNSQTNQVQNSDKASKVNKVAGNNPNEKKSEEKNLTKEELKEGVEQLNEAVQAFHEEMKFELHEKSERMMVKIVNIDQNKVIKEIPPKEVLDMLGKIKDMVGLIIDKKI